VTKDNAPYRDRFVIADPSIAYLDGNSLGRLPKRTVTILQEVVRHQWGEALIGGWNSYWLSLSTRIGDKIGSLIGAPPGTTVVCDSTSINLYKLAWAMLQQTGGRRTILTDRANFPSDQYILQGLAAQSDDRYTLKVLDLDSGDPSDVEGRLARAIDEDTALVCLSHVHYKSGYAFAMDVVTRLVHERGSKILWDVSHSVGAMPIPLAECRADGAVGCTYKYLNGGPGAPAFLYVRQDLCDTLANPIQGWFGANRPFDFSNHYEPGPGIARFVVGTPPILALAAVEPGVDLVLEAGIERLHDRSIRMSEYFIEQFDHRLSALGYVLQTPRSPSQRGSHLSLGHPHAWQITQSLIHRHGVVPDFRDPNTIRFGITPLVTTFEEIDQAVEGLAATLHTKDFELFSAERRGVT
jgi:kynureninase